MKKLLVAAVGATVMALGAPAQATPITSVEYNGGVFSVEYLGSPGTDQYDIQYTADFTAFVPGPHETYIWGINFKPSLGNLESIVSASTTASGSWSFFVDKSLSANGCGGGGADFVCGEEALPADQATTGNVLTWDLRLGITGAGTSPENMIFGAPIRAVFTNNETTNGHGKYQTSLMSLTTPDDDGGGITDVPEPGSMLLLGTGLTGLAILLRRRRN